MRCEDTSARLADYLAGTLPDTEREQLERHAQSCAACRKELDEAAATWRQLGEIPARKPASRAMRARFDGLLSDWEDGRTQVVSPPPRGGNGSWPHRQGLWRPLLVQGLAAAVVLTVGIQIGREIARPAAASPDVTELRQEVRDLRQMVTLSLMQQQSASERLKGVSWSGQLDRPGNEVVAALIETLMNDSNVNVRLASIDALKRFAGRETVQSAAIHALDTQTSPLVQIALIDFVVETQERGALDSLRRLSRDEKVNEAVRERAAWGIDHLGAA